MESLLMLSLYLYKFTYIKQMHNLPVSFSTMHLFGHFNFAHAQALNDWLLTAMITGLGVEQ